MHNCNGYTPEGLNFCDWHELYVRFNGTLRKTVSLIRLERLYRFQPNVYLQLMSPWLRISVFEIPHTNVRIYLAVSELLRASWTDHQQICQTDSGLNGQDLKGSCIAMNHVLWGLKGELDIGCMQVYLAICLYH